MEVPLSEIPPQADGSPPDRPPEGSEPPGPPAPRRGLSTGQIVALVIVAVALLAYGTCVAIVNSRGH